MNTTNIFTVVAIIVVLGGGVFFLSRNSETAVMEKQEDVITPKQSEADAMGQAQETSGGMVEDEGAMTEKKDETAMMNKGSYETYAPEKLAKAHEGDVVLFFRASWCPTCRTLDADIRRNVNAIPAGVTILDVDYDSFKELKAKYGVTYQHTLVQVDANGNLIAKWSGSPTLSSLLSNIK